MNWLRTYQDKAKKWHLIAWLILLLFALFIVFLICILGDDEITIIISVAIGFIGFIVWIDLLSVKVVWRKYNGHCICIYAAPIKNYFIIDNELQGSGGPFQFYYYGQLQDGTEVTAKFDAWGGVKFAIGSFDNQNHSFF